MLPIADDWNTNKPIYILYLNIYFFVFLNQQFSFAILWWNLFHIILLIVIVALNKLTIQGSGVIYDS